MSKELNDKVLYSLDSKGKVREWKASTDLTPDSNGYLTITIEHGQQGGKKQLKERKVKAGKNKGKANETTVVDQTYLEIGYLYQKQYDQGYVNNISEYKTPRRPMLAYKYKEKCHKIVWVTDKQLKDKLAWSKQQEESLQKREKELARQELNLEVAIKSTEEVRIQLEEKLAAIRSLGV